MFQACTMAMVALGLNLIYGFNGQFSLAQWGFYGIGAYCAADITYRWINGDARGLVVVGVGTVLGGLAIMLINRALRRMRGVSRCFPPSPSTCWGRPSPASWPWLAGRLLGPRWCR